MQSRALAILDSASRYVSREAKRAYNREEHEDFSITLKLLELLRDGWASGPGVFDVACGYAVGLPHARYLHKRSERAAFVRREFLQAIPDYDLSREPLPERDPADGRRRSKGRESRLDTRTIKEAAAKLGITKAAIYRRLRDGWTSQQAIAETRQPPGRSPHGNRIRILAAQDGARLDTIPSRVPDENQPPASERPRDRSTADDRYSVPNGESTERYTVRSVTDRRRAPKKRVSSRRSVWTDLDLHGRQELARSLVRARWAKYDRNSQDTEASTSSVLYYLESAEATETELSRQCDLRMAWITVRNAARGLAQPFVAASYASWGVHPDKLQAKIEARRQAKLGTLFGKEKTAPKFGDIEVAVVKPIRLVEAVEASRRARVGFAGPSRLRNHVNFTPAFTERANSEMPRL